MGAAKRSLTTQLLLFALGGSSAVESPAEAVFARQRLGLRKPGARYYVQRQDHFDAENTNTWRQAYYVNDSFWTPGSDAPVFLCVGGEGPPLDGSAVVASVHCNIAVEWLQEKKALMFALEHRYYGCHNMSACPVSDLTRPDALMFLSSRQAVEDIASFVTAMNTEFELARNKWVTWGGSYPGMLAGWSRLKHPELIHASVASSAPVSATLDMPEYMDHMAFAYSVTDNHVGGSAGCRDAIRKGHAWIEERFLASDEASVEQRFGIANGSLQSLEQRVDFAASGVAEFPAQENDPLCTAPACNIAKVCEIMTNTSLGDEVDRLIQLRKAQGVTESLAVSGFQARHSLAPWTRTRLKGLGASLQSGAAPWPDFWFYQTCKEFGFYQTCEEQSSCMFVRGILNVSFLAGGCMTEFNISIEDVERNIDATNFHYGGVLPTGVDGKLGRCVMFPNGEVDPWSTRSVLKAPSKYLPTLKVDGASHHSWTWPSRSGDQESVMAARTRIREQVDLFLGSDCSEAGKGDAKSNGPPSTILIVGIVATVLVLLMLVGLVLRSRKARQPPLLSSTQEGATNVSLSQRG